MTTIRCLAVLTALLASTACASHSVAQADTAPASQPAWLSAAMEQDAVYAALETVATWQLARYNPETNLFEGYEEGHHMAPTDESSHPQGWVYAALHVGMARWAMLAEQHGDPRYVEWLETVAKRNKYLFSPRIYNADDYAIGQLYLDLYERDPDPEKLVPLRVVFELILNTPSTIPLQYERVEEISAITGTRIENEWSNRRFHITPCKYRWCWADALFMGPPVWIHLAEVTGDERYLEFADREFWVTVETLWDEDDHLFFRDTRFYDRREPNGEKVIWARGVGWVAAGLARMLEHLPQEHPRRSDYEDLFRKMMTRLAGAQQADGLWRPSVLAPETQPFKETSGTALMGFAFASGINQGVLDEATFRPVVEKAWGGLIEAVQPSGKLGWVQPIGHKPESVDKEDTQLYAVGGFLAMGAEIHKMLEADGTGS